MNLDRALILAREYAAHGWSLPAEVAAALITEVDRLRAELAATQAAHLKRWEAPIKASGFKAE